MIGVGTRGPGGPEMLTLAEYPDPVPGPGEILIRVSATAVNRADVLQRQGRYPPPPGTTDILGLEAAGTVERLGSGVTGFAPGDRVMALLAGGGYAELVATPAGQVMHVPDALDDILAAAVPEAYLTAWQALGRTAPPQPGDRVLVHAAASGVGTAALQIARELGARCIATTRSTEKAWMLEDRAEHVVVPTNGEFAEQVTALTDGRGVDRVVDLVGAAYLRESLRCLATGGHILLIGMVGGRRVDLDLGELFAKRATLTASTLRARPLEEKAALVADFAEWGLPRLADGRLRPTVHDMLPVSRVQDAHRMVEANEPLGKVVLSLTADAIQER